MKKSTLFLSLAMGIFALPSTLYAAEEYMEPATLVSPSSLQVSMAPFSVDITWDNEPIELVDPYLNDFDEEVVDVFVTLDDGEPQSVSAAILSSVWDNGEDDVWDLEVALYELDEIFDFNGDKITVSIPAGIVKNEEGLLNPAQDFVFTIIQAYTKYELTPESGSVLALPEAYVTLSFGDAKPVYSSGEVIMYVYEPDFEEIDLEYGKEVTVNADNEVVINLNSLKPGWYEMLIPEGMFSMTVDGVDYISPDIWLEYTIEATDGVSSLTNEQVNTPVFNLKGMRMGDSNNLNVLKPGIYVVNGKKVIVK